MMLARMSFRSQNHDIPITNPCHSDHKTTSFRAERGIFLPSHQRKGSSGVFSVGEWKCEHHCSSFQSFQSFPSQFITNRICYNSA